MADIISPILNIVSLLCSCSANNKCCYLFDLQENKDVLETAMEELQATRADVKRRVEEAENNPNEAMKRTHEVDSWLQRVQTIEGEVGEILEKTDQEIQGRCFGGYCPKNCWSARKIGKLVIRKLPIVTDLRSKGSFGDVAYRLPPPLVQRAPEDITVGMESIFDKVWSLLAEDEIRIMGLYGYGGVGKTTLLKQINNEFLKSTTTTTHGFDVVILVVVSKEVNIGAIQKEIGKRLGLSSTEANKTSIFNALSNKNFVLLLDDIWERVDLQSIGVPRPENRKSKVLFTTRSETVCGLMEANKMVKVECLPLNEAWCLFQEKVGKVALNSFPSAPELAKDVAEECGGLPLALITIGRAMSTKKSREEWNHAITTLRKSASEFPGMGDEVLPLLKLSYDSLRNNTIKSCFLYCAMYPEDHSINKARLIDYWIGEGLISLNEFDHINEARNHGYDVIGNLRGACLLESGFFEETEVKMHDTIRDLALWIACECGSSKRDKMLITGSFYGKPEKWYNAERIFLKPIPCDVIEIPPPPLKSPNLLTLLYQLSLGVNILPVPQDFFEFMPLLRVLDLRCCPMKTFPTSITQLLELQYLSLSYTTIEVIPEELGKLVNLKYLDLSFMNRLVEIPSGVIGSLLELRVLNIYSCCPEAVWDVIGELHHLKHLDDLGITVNTQHALMSNRNLRIPTRHLHLSECNDISQSPSSSTIRTSRVDSMKSVRELELFSKFCNLETLSLESLLMNMGSWENHHDYYIAQQQQQLGSSFQNLSEISIIRCNGLKDITWVGYVGNLKILSLFCCEELEEIVIVVDHFGGTTKGGDEIPTMMNIVDVFKRLKKIYLSDLPKLKSICRNALAFPCLEYMFVYGCPQLKKLPLNSGSNVNNTLQDILGEREWWNELQWEDHYNVESKFLPYFDKDHPFPRDY